jgi:Fe-S cluster assembly iron-binding protein IscA
MLEITKPATEKLQEYLTDNNLSGPVRVAMHRGCGGASLGLALDDKKASDTAVNLDGVELIFDTILLGECGRTIVDFKPPSGCGCGEGGFVITTEIPLPGGGGGCGSSCSSGSCG